MPLQSILIISGHPNLSASHANALILARLENAGLNAKIRYLDKLYADGTPINVAQEHTAMLAADIIVLQYPLYWYAVPALLKKWIDAVFTFRFSFGPDGSKLRGKTLLNSVTIGSHEDKYMPAKERDDDMAIEAFLKPTHALAAFSEMEILAPICSFKMSYIQGIHTDNTDVLERAERHAKALIKALKDES